MNGSPLIVMYHYVWPDDKPVPGGIRPLFAREFQAQLDWLSARYEIVGGSEFLLRIGKKSADRKPPCLLTFDDGTRDHAEVAAPILAARNLSGVFFVLSSPAELNKMPATHGLHWLLGQEEKSVWRIFCDYAEANLGGEGALGSAADAERIYYYESALRARIKYAANMALAPEVTEQIVAQSASAVGMALSDLSAQWFASADQIKQMHRLGMEIGMHGVSHRSLQTLGAKGIGEEIRHCSSYLTSLTGRRPTWWACPFGGSGAAPEALAAMQTALDEVGVRAAVTAVKGVVAAQTNVRELPRLDTIDLPPRKSAADLA